MSEEGRLESAIGDKFTDSAVELGAKVLQRSLCGFSVLIFAAVKDLYRCYGGFLSRLYVLGAKKRTRVMTTSRRVRLATEAALSTFSARAETAL